MLISTSSHTSGYCRGRVWRCIGTVTQRLCAQSSVCRYAPLAFGILCRNTHAGHHILPQRTDHCGRGGMVYGAAGILTGILCKRTCGYEAQQPYEPAFHAGTVFRQPRHNYARVQYRGGAEAECENDMHCPPCRPEVLGDALPAVTPLHHCRSYARIQYHAFAR